MDVKIDSEYLIEELQNLVRIPSVNPSLVKGAPGEGNIARHVAKRLADLGFTVQLDNVAPGRPNVIGILPGAGGGGSLLFNGHVDTVSVEGMTAPFSAEIRGGRLYGRGAQDMKASLAATLAAARAVVARGRPLRGDLVLTFVADEEHASLGTARIVDSILSGELKRPDAVINTEPTELRVGVAHKGFAWIEVETRGRAAHGSRPSEGIDAIVHMGRVLGRIEELSRSLSAGRAHPLLGHGSLHASLVKGGRELSSYPDQCSLWIERRIVPPETATQAGAEIASLLHRLAEEDSQFQASSRLDFSRPPWEADQGQGIVACLRQAATAVLGEEVQEMGHSAWLDVVLLAELGLPAVVFGPTGGGMHGVEEWIDLESVIRCADIYARLILDFCSSL